LSDNEEGHFRCGICDYCELTDDGRRRTFGYDKKHNQYVCDECTTAIGESLSEFEPTLTNSEDRYAWKKQVDFTKKEPWTSGSFTKIDKNHKRKPGGRRNFRGYNPSQAPQEPAVRRPTAQQSAYWDAILEAVDEVGE
jgi:transcription initiation factor TFIIIB Brf1 subunit/transcription initiation factor TFIIB